MSAKFAELVAELKTVKGSSELATRRAVLLRQGTISDRSALLFLLECVAQFYEALGIEFHPDVNDPARQLVSAQPTLTDLSVYFKHADRVSELEEQISDLEDELHTEQYVTEQMRQRWTIQGEKERLDLFKLEQRINQLFHLTEQRALVQDLIHEIKRLRDSVEYTEDTKKHEAAVQALRTRLEQGEEVEQELIDALEAWGLVESAENERRMKGPYLTEIAKTQIAMTKAVVKQLKRKKGDG